MDGAQCTSRKGIFQAQDSKPALTRFAEDSCSTVVFQESVAEHFKAAQQNLATHLEAAAAFIAKRLEVVNSLEKRVASLQAENRRLQTLAPKTPWHSEQHAAPKSPWTPEQKAVPQSPWSSERDVAVKSPWTSEQNEAPKSQWSSEPDPQVLQGTESTSSSSSIFPVGTANNRHEDGAAANPADAQVSQPRTSPGEQLELPKSAKTRRRISAPANMRGQTEMELKVASRMQNAAGDSTEGDTSPRSVAGTKSFAGFTDLMSVQSNTDDGSISKPMNIIAVRSIKSDSVASEPASPRREKRTSICSVDSASTTQSVDSVYEVLPHWVMRSNASRRDAVSKVSFGSLSTLNSAELNSVDGSAEKDIDSSCACVIQPHTSRRAFWDIASFSFVLYDMTVIPLAFLNPPDFLFFDIMSWATRFFWTFDIVMSCCTGYMKPNGALELRWREVVKQYLKTWFVLDLFIVLLDWTELFWSGSNNAGYARLGKASRVFRVVRMLRLLRILRARKLMLIITARIQSERLIIMAHMVQLMIILVGCSHLSACIWYGIGTAASPGKNWIEQFFTDEQEDSFGYRYFSSLHWSLCQFTGGMDEIRPSNLSERIFNIVMFLLAFVMAAVFVSHLTSSMTQLNMMSSQQLLHLAALRRFLLENGISDLLSRRIQHSAQYAMREQQRITPEASVELLKTVSGTLRVELHFELYSPFLAQHRFFSRYMVEWPNVVKRICHEAMSIEDYTKGDDVFTDGELPRHPKMFAVHSGRFVYERSLEFPQEVEPGTWICEAVMWTRWRHRGTLTAGSHRCRLCSLDASRFQQIVRQFKGNGYGPREYANNFVQELNQKGLDGSNVSDLPFDLCLPHLPVKSDKARRESLQKVMPWLKDSAISALEPCDSRNF